MSTRLPVSVSRTFALSFIASAVLLANISVAEDGALKPSKDPRLAKAFAQLPLSFEANRGQVESGVKYISRGNGYTFYITENEVLLSLSKRGRVDVAPRLLRMTLAGAKPADIHAEDVLPGKANYFLGDKKVSDVELYGKVRSVNAYPGIDVVYYGNQRELEYDFVLAAGADPNLIRMIVEGAEKAEVTGDGAIVFSFGSESIRQHKPVIYQTVAGEKREIAGRYVLAAEKDTGSYSVSFEIDSYDASIPLVIDPILVYSTYLGDKPNNPPASTSEESGDEGGNGIAIDAQGNAYVVGFSNSVEFPLQSQIIKFVALTRPHGRLQYQAYITKFDPIAATLVYSTYLGGVSGQSQATGVVVDSTGAAYVCGFTTAADFPLKNALQSGNQGNGDGFILKMTPGGGNIEFSTYYGGSANDGVNAIALDTQNNVYFAGTTSSSNLHAANPLQPVNAGGTDAFVGKIRSDGSVLIYGTYLGGRFDDGATGIVADPSGNAYITGYTKSPDFPIASAIQVQNRGGSDVFVSKVNPNGALLVYSTYLGGTSDDQANAIALDSDSNVYVTGFSSSTNYPTVSPTVLPVQAVNSGGKDAIISKLSSRGDALIFSTYLGGAADDIGKAIAVDSRGAVYVVGSTASKTDFPVAPGTNTLQSGYAGGDADGFISKFNPTGVPMVFSTYFGGPDADEVRAIVVDNNGNSYVSGYSKGAFTITFGAFQAASGEDFPAPPFDPFDPAEVGSFVDEGDAYVSKIFDSSPLITSPKVASAVYDPNPDSAYPPFAYTITATNNPTSFNAAGLPRGLSVNTADGQISGRPLQAGRFTVVLIASNASGTGSQILTLNVSAGPPSITNTNLNVTTFTNQIFTYQINATNDPDQYAATNLPQGLAIDTITGLISGVPLTEGNFQISISATNGAGTDSKTLRLTVKPAPPVISSPALVQAILNVPFSYQIAATNNPSSYDAAGLPDGVTVDTTTGLITGTITTLGSFSMQVSASNGGGTGTMTVSLQVIPPLIPVITSSDVATGTVGVLFTYQITANNNPLAFGVGPLEPGGLGLPDGLSLDNRTGIISGIPTALSGQPTDLTLTSKSLVGSGSLAGRPITMTTGAAATLTSIIDTFDSKTGTITLLFGFGAPVAIGDEFDVQNTATITATPPSAKFTASGLSGQPSLVGKVVQFTTGANTNSSATITSFSPDTGDISVNTPFPNTPAIDDAFTVSIVGVVSGISSDAPNSSFNTTDLVGYVGLEGSELTFNSGANANQTRIIVATDPSTGQVFVDSDFNAPIATADVFTVTLHSTVTSNPPASQFISTDLIGAGSLQGKFVTINDGPAAGQTRTIVLFDSLSGLIRVDEPFTVTPAVGNTITVVTHGVVSASPLTIRMSATNAAGTGSKPLSLIFDNPPVPVIQPPFEVIAKVQTPFQYSIVATNNATSFDALGLPDGLSINNSTGVISGTPTLPSQGGVPYEVTLFAANDGGSGNAVLKIDIQDLSQPIVISDNTAQGIVGVPFEYQVLATNAANSYTADPMPDGLQLDASTGLISGTPTTEGTTEVLITATNPALLTSDVFSLLITITQAIPPQITSPLEVNGIDGAPFTYEIKVTGTGPFLYDAQGLPPGLELVGDTITGRPAGTGAFDVQLQVANAALQSDTELLRITISASPPTITSSHLASGTVGISFSYQITVSGTEPVTINASPIPPGLTFNAAARTISGTPTNASVGTTRVVITAVNDQGNAPPKELFITINPALPVMSGSTFVTAFEGKLFNFTIPTTGTPQIVFTATGLPNGLVLTGNSINGTPLVSAIGVHNVRITATNGAGSVAKDLTIFVQPSPPVITSGATATGQIGSPFTPYTITATGTAPFIFSADPLPPGLTLEGSNIVGIPTEVGTFTVQLTATNSADTGDTKTLTINITNAPPKLTSSLTATGAEDIPFSFQLTASGTQPIQFFATLPPALNLSLDPTTGTISGTPATNGVFTIPIAAVNDFGTDTKNLSLTISATRAQVTNTELIVEAAPNSPFSYQITAIGTKPITYFFNSGDLNGLTLSGDTITGTPSTLGTYNTTITAQNTIGGVNFADSKTLVINVVDTPPTITSSLVKETRDGEQFSYVITARGSPTITYTVTTPLPPGVTFGFDPNNGAPTISGAVDISGTTTLVKTFDIGIKASNFLGDDEQTLQLKVSAVKPAITSSLTATAVQGQPFSYTITATGTAVIDFNATGLPAGLTFSGNTISGTPTKTGTAGVTLTAHNIAGNSDPRILQLTITAVKPVISSALTAFGTINQAFSYDITATNIPTSFNASGLPPGLSIDAQTGRISGTPTQTGTFDVTIAAINAGGSGTATLRITINTDAAQISGPLNVTGQVGTPFTYTPSATGLQPITFTLAAAPGSILPPGLSISGDILTGTPTLAGEYQVLITATNAVNTDTEILTITINPRPDDSDLDGFPDEMEVLIGTNPNDAGSNPFINNSGDLRSLNITSMTVKLNFATGAKDSIAIKGTAQTGASAVAGTQVVVYVGGILQRFTLDARGKAKVSNGLGGGTGNANGTATISVGKGPNSTVLISFKGGDYRSFLNEEGLTNENVKTPRAASISVAVLMNNILHKSDKVLSYTAKAGKTGSAKQPKR